MSNPNKILVVVAFGVGCAATACESGETGLLADPSLEDVQWVQRGIGIQYHIMSDGIRSSTLQADTLYSFGSNGQDSVVMVGMRLILYDPNGAERARITADHGMMLPVSEQMYARGNARLVIPAEQRIIESDTIWFDPRGAGLVKSDVFTWMTDAERTSCGTGFSSDLEFRRIQVFNPMSGDAFCGR